MRRVHLHGKLAELHAGGHLDIAVDTPREVIGFLSAVLPGFKAEINRAGYYLALGDANKPRLEQAFYDVRLGRLPSVHILPDPSGRKVGGAPTNIAPASSAYENRDDAFISALFNGPVNSTEQGIAVPVIYGRVRNAGAATISAGISVEQMPYNTPVPDIVFVSPYNTL